MPEEIIYYPICWVKSVWWVCVTEWLLSDITSLLFLTDRAQHLPRRQKPEHGCRHGCHKADRKSHSEDIHLVSHNLITTHAHGAGIITRRSGYLLLVQLVLGLSDAVWSLGENGVIRQDAMSAVRCPRPAVTTDSISDPDYELDVGVASGGRLRRTGVLLPRSDRRRFRTDPHFIGSLFSLRLSGQNNRPTTKAQNGGY